MVQATLYNTKYNAGFEMLSKCSLITVQDEDSEITWHLLRCLHTDVHFIRLNRNMDMFCQGVYKLKIGIIINAAGIKYG